MDRQKADRRRKFAARQAVAELVEIAQLAATAEHMPASEAKELEKKLAAARSRVMAFIHPEAS